MSKSRRYALRCALLFPCRSVNRVVVITANEACARILQDSPRLGLTSHRTRRSGPVRPPPGSGERRPRAQNLPTEYLNDVKTMHEKGGRGSTGWRRRLPPPRTPRGVAGRRGRRGVSRGSLCGMPPPATPGADQGRAKLTEPRHGHCSQAERGLHVLSLQVRSTALAHHFGWSSEIAPLQLRAVPMKV